jgi:outer membrane protein assembly factor BamD (BamD/ComL family)
MVIGKNIGIKLSLILLMAPLLAGCATVESDYKKARSQYTIEAWESFLEKHPDTKEAQCAQIHLDHLMKSAGTSGGDNEYVDNIPNPEKTLLAKNGPAKQQTQPAEEVWQQAQESDTIKAYEDYLAAFPESLNAKEAQARIALLLVNQDWAAARKSNSMDAYRKFLKKHPTSKFSTKAKQRMESMRADHEWQKAKAQNNEAGWVDYIVSHTDTPEAKEAIKRLREHKVVGPGGIIDWIRVGGKTWSQPRDDGFSNYAGSSVKNVTIKRQKELIYYCKNTTELKFPNWVMLNKIKVTGHLKAGPAGFRLLEGLALVPTNK